MKIVTWNCSGALRTKLDQADSLQADVLVVQECENPAESSSVYRSWAGEYLWRGESRHKGIGIFPKNGRRVAMLHWSGHFRFPGLASQSQAIQWSTHELQLFLPFTVDGDINVLAVWTKGRSGREFRYIGQLWKYLQIHCEELSRPGTIIVGDLNSNSIWDRPDRWWNHTDVVNELKQMHLRSLYHEVTGEMQGCELTPTFFHRRNTEAPYHIDYAFLSPELLARATLEIGAKGEWLTFSDHMPLTVSIG